MTSLEAAQRQRVIAEAKTWLRTPYHHCAASKGVGVDCLQLLVEVFSATGLIRKDEHIYTYAEDWAVHRSEERYLEGVLHYAPEVATPHPGDIAMYVFGRCYSHAGIIIDWPLIIHAYRGIGVTYGEGDSGPLAGRRCKYLSFWAK